MVKRWAQQVILNLLESKEVSMIIVDKYIGITISLYYQLTLRLEFLKKIFGLLRSTLMSLISYFGGYGYLMLLL